MICLLCKHRMVWYLNMRCLAYIVLHTFNQRHFNQNTQFLMSVFEFYSHFTKNLLKLVIWLSCHRCSQLFWTFLVANSFQQCAALTISVMFGFKSDAPLLLNVCLCMCVRACMSECLYNSLSTKLIFTFERVGRWNWRRSHALLNIMQFEFIHTIIMKIVLLWVLLGLSIVISLKLHLSCSHRHFVNFIISLVALKRTLHHFLPLNFIKSD